MSSVHAVFSERADWAQHSCVGSEPTAAMICNSDNRFARCIRKFESDSLGVSKNHPGVLISTFRAIEAANQYPVFSNTASGSAFRVFSIDSNFIMLCEPPWR